MKILDTLIAVDELLDGPNKWSKGEYAVDEDGDKVLISSPKACAFCLVGAIERTLHQTEDTSDQAALTSYRTQAVIRDITGCGVVVYNDRRDTTFESIKSTLQKAISIARERGI